MRNGAKNPETGTGRDSYLGSDMIRTHTVQVDPGLHGPRDSWCRGAFQASLVIEVGLAIVHTPKGGTFRAI